MALNQTVCSALLRRVAASGEAASVSLDGFCSPRHPTFPIIRQRAVDQLVEDVARSVAEEPGVLRQHVAVRLQEAADMAHRPHSIRARLDDGHASPSLSASDDDWRRWRIVAVT
jgi:hypothetical protein